jgi:hypothetical protein
VGAALLLQTLHPLRLLALSQRQNRPMPNQRLLLLLLCGCNLLYRLQNAGFGLVVQRLAASLLSCPLLLHQLLLLLLRLVQQQLWPYHRQLCMQQTLVECRGCGCLWR